jgi:hypothetical protein
MSRSSSREKSWIERLVSDASPAQKFGGPRLLRYPKL